MRKARFRIDYKFSGMTNDGPTIRIILIPKNFKAYKMVWKIKVNNMLHHVIDMYVVNNVMLPELILKSEELIDFSKNQKLESLKNKPI